MMHVMSNAARIAQMQPVRAQRGVALLVVLLLLLIITLLGLSSMRGALLEERMSGSLYDRSLMFQAAESALREAETRVAALKLSDFPATTCSQGLCPRPNPGGSNDAYVDRWLLATPPYVDASPVTAGTLSVTPRYFVEFMGLAPNWVGCDRAQPMPVGCMGPRYRITALASADGRARVLLQSSFTSPE